MKKLLVTSIILCAVLGFAFGATTYHHHKWSSWYDNGYIAKTIETYDGGVVRISRNSKITYNIYIYGLGSSEGNPAWNRYVGSGYSLKYIGGSRYFSSANDWSESTPLCDVLYPSYINYLRPGN